jgi:hypothetical protein
MPVEPTEDVGLIKGGKGRVKELYDAPYSLLLCRVFGRVEYSLRYAQKLVTRDQAAA